MFGSNGNLTSLDYRWHWIHFWDWNPIYGNLLDYIHIERVWDESAFCFGNDLVFTEKFCARSKVPQTICSWLFIWVSDWVFEFNKTLGNGPRWDRRFGIDWNTVDLDSQCCTLSQDLKLKDWQQNDKIQKICCSFDEEENQRQKSFVENEFFISREPGTALHLCLLLFSELSPLHCNTSSIWLTA